MNNMMIIDINQVMLSNLMMQLGNHTNVDVSEDLLRHMVLNSIRSYRAKFGAEYSETVIACDNRHYWRKTVFPYYKANRKKSRDQSELDWNAIFTTLNKLREELKEYFPYIVIDVEGAEADDVIGTLVEANKDEFNRKILILSGDKDFIQLHKNMNVKQYDPTRKKFVTHNNPEQFLYEHIIRGDSGDGVPNFLSPDNCFVLGERQKPINSKKLEDWLGKKPETYCDDRMLRNYKRNQQLIDLDCIPVEIRERVLDSYNSQSEKPKMRSKMFNYFIANKLKNLMENINEF